MDEAEWDACTDSERMLEFLRGKAAERKLRLFACACCRMMPDLPRDFDLGPDLSSAEECVEAGVTPARLGRFFSALRGWYLRLRDAGTAGPQDFAAFHAVSRLLSADPWEAPLEIAGDVAWEAHRGLWAGLLHCVFGPLPFRPVTISPSWLIWEDGTVVRLAQAAYDNRNMPAGTLDNDRLAVLADALEEAGCIDPDLLAHLREPGPHTRGCWPVDLVLDKR